MKANPKLSDITPEVIDSVAALLAATAKAQLLREEVDEEV